METFLAGFVIVVIFVLVALVASRCFFLTTGDSPHFSEYEKYERKKKTDPANAIRYEYNQKLIGLDYQVSVMTRSKNYLVDPSLDLGKSADDVHNCLALLQGFAGHASNEDLSEMIPLMNELSYDIIGAGGDSFDDNSKGTMSLLKGTTSKIKLKSTMSKIKNKILLSEHAEKTLEEPPKSILPQIDLVDSYNKKREERQNRDFYRTKVDLLQREIEFLNQLGNNGNGIHSHRGTIYNFMKRLRNFGVHATNQDIDIVLPLLDGIEKKLRTLGKNNVPSKRQQILSSLLKNIDKVQTEINNLEESKESAQR